jgi:hypothetical protein
MTIGVRLMALEDDQELAPAGGEAILAGLLSARRHRWKARITGLQRSGDPWPCTGQCARRRILWTKRWSREAPRWCGRRGREGGKVPGSA